MPFIINLSQRDSELLELGNMRALIVVRLFTMTLLRKKTILDFPAHKESVGVGESHVIWGKQSLVEETLMS